ncbi:MAG: hypothetical protein ACRD8U_00710, partial [Pyrinomonadaceae bacterium]
MGHCVECGARLGPDEHYCGNCGTAQLHLSAMAEAAGAAQIAPEPDADSIRPTPVAAEIHSEPVSEEPNEPVSRTSKQTGELNNFAAEESPKVDAVTEAAAEVPEPKMISSDSLGGSATGDIVLSSTSSVQHTGTTGGRQPGIKQLDAGTVLNGRYEIARRIGGGGMGAVYLAKDRNLGDASRAVKE